MAGASGDAPHRSAEVPEERGDRDLLADHVAGDPEAFGLLFRRHRDRLWAVALRTLGDQEEAADALQDALVSAFRRAESFRGDAAVTTWLHRIVVNACLDRLRRRKVRAADPLPDDLEEYAARGALSTSTTRNPTSREAADPADVVLDGEQRLLVLRALDALPPDQKAALVLVDMQGYSVEEAAAILECASGTVKSRCSRGRVRLAPLLADLRPVGSGEDRPSRGAAGIAGAGAADGAGTSRRAASDGSHGAGAGAVGGSGRAPSAEPGAEPGTEPPVTPGRPSPGAVEGGERA